MGKAVKKRTTKKQAKANRTNSKKSTGPRSAEGKARVRLNAVKHGLRTEQVVVLGGPTAEDPAEFDSLLSGMLHDCKPSGALERVLVERLAVSYWRLRRAYRFEARAIEQANEPNPMSKMLEELSQLPVNKPGPQELPGLRSLDKLVRYEMMIDRELLRTAAQLQHLQHARKLEEQRDDACDTGGRANSRAGTAHHPDVADGRVGTAHHPADSGREQASGSRPDGRAAARGTPAGAATPAPRTGGQAASGTPAGTVPNAPKAQWPNKPISQPSASRRTTSVQVAIPAYAVARPTRPWHAGGLSTSWGSGRGATGSL